jgi:hypothetical protein
LTIALGVSAASKSLPYTVRLSQRRAAYDEGVEGPLLRTPIELNGPGMSGDSDARPPLSLDYERIDRHAAVRELFVALAGPERLQLVAAATCRTTFCVRVTSRPIAMRLDAATAVWQGLTDRLPTVFTKVPKRDV